MILDGFRRSTEHAGAIDIEDALRCAQRCSDSLTAQLINFQPQAFLLRERTIRFSIIVVAKRQGDCFRRPHRRRGGAVEAKRCG